MDKENNWLKEAIDILIKAEKENDTALIHKAIIWLHMELDKRYDKV